MGMVEFWYRYTNQQYAPSVDEFDNITGSSTTGVTLHQYPVQKETPKGVWLDVYGERRFVLKDARKRYACPTIEEAKESFIARKNREIGILRAQMQNAERALEIIKTGGKRAYFGSSIWCAGGRDPLHAGDPSAA